jgi:hypothetical protein
MSVNPAAKQRSFHDIVATMRAHIARADGVAQQRLSGGLELILVRQGEQHTLTLRRINVPPSAVEITVVRGAFDVPIGEEPQPFARRALLPKTGDTVLYRGVTLTWREVAR